jgi:hypothetical protein
MDERVPMGVLGAFGIMGGLSVLMLPETGDRPMAATLQEGEELPRYPYRNTCVKLATTAAWKTELNPRQGAVIPFKVPTAFR